MVSSSSSALIAGQPLSLSKEGVVSSSLAQHGPGAYPVILCDPPWKFKVFSKKGLGKSAERHYQTLEYAAIVELMGGVKVADDCVLFLWVTDPMLEKGLNLIRDMGFTYKTVAFTWVKKTKHGKDHMGTGYYTRANPEMCLLATKGKPLQRKSKSVRQLMVSPLREHSRKPDEIYDRIEELFDGPYLEIFARTRRSGWAALGNEVDKFGRQ
jgi:N6-adenosine-specific RNA methylase IME4